MRLIDAEYLKEHVFACATNGRPLHHMELSELFDAIDDVPTIEPERKKGEWINRSFNIMYPEWERYTCSACGKHAYNYDFCPNCGADMRGDEDG